MPTITLQQGDCLSSVALAAGFDPQTVWEHGDNAALRDKRVDPNALLPGDKLVVPEIEEKDEAVETDTVTTFKLSVGPIRLRIRLTRHGEARAGEAYTLTLDDGVELSGETDGEGWIDQPISIGACAATLSLREGAEVHELVIGHLDPHDEASGVQGRLRGLGYYFGEVDGEIGAKSKAALRRFQKAKGLAVTGEADGGTIEALREAFGS